MASVYNFIVIQMAGKDRKIKVLFTIPNFDTAGSGKALLKIAINLDSNLFEPHIACFHDRGKFFKTVKESGIPTHIIQYTHPMNNRLRGVIHSWKISRFFRKNRFDIIHSYHYGSDYSEALAAKLAGVKWVYTKKNMNWGGPSTNSWRLRTALASTIVYQNQDMKDKFFQDRNNLCFIPRGVDRNEFYQRERDIDLMKEFNISENDKVVVCVANIVPIKGIDYLLNAFNNVAKDNDKLKLIIIGNYQSEYGDKIRAEASTLETSDRIIFTGKRFDVKSFLSIADLFVLSTLSKGEGSPVSLLEAMSSGVLVLGSRIPGIKDQLKDLKELMFEPGNIEELTDKMLWAINLDEKKKRQLIQEIVNTVKKQYTIDREVKDHENLYLTLLNNRS